jgi:hypothetical protein
LGKFLLKKQPICAGVAEAAREDRERPCALLDRLGRDFQYGFCFYSNKNGIDLPVDVAEARIGLLPEELGLVRFDEVELARR